MKIHSYTAHCTGESKDKDVEDGAKFITEKTYMDRAASREKVNLFQELDNCTSIEISEEGLEKLLKVKNENPERKILSEEEKTQLLRDSLKPVQKLHRIIPNIQTNDKLEKSLQGADESTVDAAYDIIKHKLLPHQVGSLTEKERQELILSGVAEAKQLAGELTADKAALFMEAMETIAKYGMNGEKDGQGNVTYDIRKGAMVGAPDDYISTGDLMQKIAPQQYKKYCEMMAESLAEKDYTLLIKAMKYMMDWEQRAYKENPQPFEEEKQKQAEWKRNMENTRLEISGF